MNSPKKRIGTQSSMGPVGCETSTKWDHINFSLITLIINEYWYATLLNLAHKVIKILNIT